MTQSPPSQLRYLKNKYNNDEEYKQKQREKSKLQYERNKEAIKERYKNDAEYREKILLRAKEKARIKSLSQIIA
jgi:hypothetical protein